MFLKTVSGLRPVHAILRRLDDDYCDPLELRSDSTLGVPGLVQAWRAGHVLVANAFGTSVLESPALLGVPAGRLRAAARRAARERRRSRRGGAASRRRSTPRPPTAAASSSRRSRTRRWSRCSSTTSTPPAAREWAERLRRRAGRLRGRGAPAAVARAGLARRPPREPRADAARVPGRRRPRRLHADAGRTVAHRRPTDRPIVSSQRGGSSKDTWVLSDRGRAARPPRQPARAARARGRRSIAGVSSRAAEHLFWLGRYAERSESTRAAAARRAVPADRSGGARPCSQPLFLRACLSQGLLDAADTAADASFADPASRRTRSTVRLVDNLFDRQSRRSLAFNVEQTVRVAGAVRDRLSPDNWRLLRQLHELVPAPPPASIDLDDTLELIDRGDRLARRRRRARDGAHDARRRLAVSQPRPASRAAHVRRVHARAARARRGRPSHALLEWLLELSDSLITYRARYMRQPDWPAVVDLLLFDARNPRSALFQLGEDREARAGCCRARPRSTRWPDIDALERMCRADDRRQGDLFGHVAGRRAARQLPAGGASACPTRSRCATSATCTSCRTRRPDDRGTDERRDRVRRRVVYRIEHETRYVHAGRVSTSQHVACLTPRDAAAPARPLARARRRPAPGQRQPAASTTSATSRISSRS